MKCVVDENLYQIVLQSVSNGVFGIPEQHHVPKRKKTQNMQYLQSWIIQRVRVESSQKSQETLTTMTRLFSMTFKVSILFRKLKNVSSFQNHSKMAQWKKQNIFIFSFSINYLQKMLMCSIKSKNAWSIFIITYQKVDCH